MPSLTPVIVLVTLASMEHAAPLIGEARERQRRRRLTIAWGVVAAALLVIAVSTTAPRPSVQGRFHSPPALVPASAVFTRAPYMGVRCPAANSISCDRVGLAVWLRNPAVRVTATIAGQPLVLEWFGDRRRVGPLPPRSELDGYLMPAHITTRLGVRPNSLGLWFGDATAPWPSPLVKFWLTYRNGQHITTELHVALSTGWG